VPTTSTLTIRPAVPADVPTIVELIRALASYERLEDECRADADLLRGHLFGPRPSCEVIIAEQEGAAVGFALFFHNYSTFLTKPGIYLEDLFVRPEARGSGVGRALLARLAELAVERGCGRLEWAVLKWNQPAIGFYEKLGARPMDTWTVYRLTGDALTSLASGTLHGTESGR
jgi:GNAT superfamily N-acetyltransferase